MADVFKFDVFLSHSTKDKAVVRPIAERLRADALKVWFDEWEIIPANGIAHRTNEGTPEGHSAELIRDAPSDGPRGAPLLARVNGIATVRLLRIDI